MSAIEADRSQGEATRVLMEITSILLSVPEHKRQDVYDEWVQMARQRKSGKTRRHMRSSVENYDPGAVGCDDSVCSPFLEDSAEMIFRCPLSSPDTGGGCY